MTLSEKQLILHKSHVTASQVPIILGVSPFRSPLQLAEQKLGSGHSNNTAATERGHILEDTVARHCATVFGFRSIEMPRDLFSRCENMEPGVDYESDTLFHADIECFASTGDRIAYLEDGEMLNYEIKTSASRSGWYGDGVPEHIWVQVQWQMFVLRSHGFDVRRTAIGALLASDFHTRIVNWDEAFISRIIGECLEFQTFINRGEIPANLNIKTSNRLAPDRVSEKQELIIRNIAETRKRRDEADRELRRLTEMALVQFGDVSGAVLEDGMSIVVYQRSYQEKLDVGKVMGQLASLCRLKGLDREVEQIKRECTSTKLREAYVQVRKPRRK